MSNSKIEDYCYIMVSSALGLGLSPLAPGSCGALLGVMLHIIISLLLPIGLQWLAIISVFLLVVVANYLLTPWAEAYWQRKDPEHFVLDEVAGYLLIPILFPFGRLWPNVLYAFLIFRILDIVKVPPAWQIDKSYHGAAGIILDDLVSSCYTVAVLYALQWLGWLGGA